MSQRDRWISFRDILSKNDYIIVRDSYGSDGNSVGLPQFYKTTSLDSVIKELEKIITTMKDEIKEMDDTPVDIFGENNNVILNFYWGSKRGNAENVYLFNVNSQERKQVENRLHDHVATAMKWKRYQSPRRNSGMLEL